MSEEELQKALEIMTQPIEFRLTENNQLKADLIKEELAYSNLRDTYNKKYDECKLYKEVIEEVRETLINSKEYKMANAMNLNAKQSVLVELLQILDKAKVGDK